MKSEADKRLDARLARQAPVGDSVVCHYCQRRVRVARLVMDRGGHGDARGREAKR